MTRKIAIIIPTYEEKLKHNEKISLCQCRRILRKYDRFFIAPKGISLNYATDETIIYVKPEYLSSRKKYSDYVLSLEFYDMFKEYEYILIYQLDSFVFSDEVEQFCKLRYDFIGAPWIYGLECHISEKKLWYMGNGGFSLRRVKAFIKWINECNEEIENAKMILPEDLVIAIYGNEYLQLAPKDVGLSFSFDLNPSTCFEQYNEKLPFGCHAWHRFENEFWKPIIDSFGYEMKKAAYIDDETYLLSSGKERSEMLNKYFDKAVIDECLRELIQDYEGEIYVFGAGQYGLSFSSMVKDSKVTIKGYLDNDELKKGKKVNGYEIFAPSIIQTGDIVFIALARPEYVMNQLIDMGLELGKQFTTSHELQMKMIEWKGKLSDDSKRR